MNIDDLWQDVTSVCAATCKFSVSEGVRDQVACICFEVGALFVTDRFINIFLIYDS